MRFSDRVLPVDQLKSANATRGSPRREQAATKPLSSPRSFTGCISLAEAAGLKTEDRDSIPSELGGSRKRSSGFPGDPSFERLRYESGVHRVQRVPATEGSGPHSYIHSNRAGLPEAEDIDV